MKHGRILVGAALAVALAVASPIPTTDADQSDPRLDELFDALHDAQTPSIVGAIESEIWQIWLSSGDDEIDLLFRRGAAAMTFGQFGAAKNMFDRIIAERPDIAEGWNKRATVLYLMGDYEGSIADIDETLKREPRHFGALFGLGLCHLNLGDKEAALDAFKRTLVAHPHSNSAKDQVKRLSLEVNGPEI